MLTKQIKVTGPQGMTSDITSNSYGSPLDLQTQISQNKRKLEEEKLDKRSLHHH